MQEPDCVDTEVFVGVDIAKGDHYACAVSAAGTEVLSRAVPNDETAIGWLIDDDATHGRVALVIDTTSSAAALLMEIAAKLHLATAYVTGLAMRRAADLYAGAAKTEPKDALVLADYARHNADRLSWTTPSDELLVRLRILNGRDADLAADATRAANRPQRRPVGRVACAGARRGDKLSSSGGARDALARWSTPTALRTAGRARIRTRIAKRSPEQRTGSPTPSGARWTRRASPSQLRRPGRHHHRVRRRLGPDLRSPRPPRRRHRGSVHGPPAGKSPRQPVRVRPANRCPDPR